MKNLIKLLIILSFLIKGIVSFAQFAGGSGTESDPWLIETTEQLSNVGNYLGPENWDKCFKLNANIELDVPPWNEGLGWMPFGYYAGEDPNNSINDLTAFGGSFNGNGYIINGLYINRPGRNGVGLFGSTSGIRIENLGLTNVSINGNNSVGGSIGVNYLRDAYISGCFVTGEVKGNSDVGGFIGELIYGDVTINNCYTHASTSGTTNIGGFIGKLHSTYYLYHRVNSCYSSGIVSGSSYAGGFVGYANDYSDSNCFWDIETSGQTTSYGGNGISTQEAKYFITYLIADWDLKGYGPKGIWNIGNSQNNGYPYLDWEYPNDPPYEPSENILPIIKTISVSVETSSSLTGVAKIYYHGNPNATNHGFCWNTSGYPTINDSKTDEGPVNTIGNFSSAISGLTPSIDYYVRPYATNLAGTAYGEEICISTPLIDPICPEGDGTDINPYLIASLNNLVWMQLNSTTFKYYLQTNDIDASETVLWESGKGWEPFQFQGSYNGNNFMIYGLHINRPEEDYVGLFYSFHYGKIINLGLVNVNIIGKNNVGALSGNMWDSHFSNCYSSGTVIGNNKVGGLIGIIVGSYSSVASNNYTNSTVTGNDYVGGIVGWCNMSIKESFSTGSITGNNYIGGLLGYAQGNVTNCYSSSNIVGNQVIGGLVGALDETKILYSYSIGEVTGNSLVGGLLGSKVENNGTISYSYWNTETSGQDTSAGGMGFTTAEMLQQNSFTNWNFIDIWSINENVSYPYLKCQGGAFEWNYPQGTSIYPLSLITFPNISGVTSGAGYYPEGTEIEINVSPRDGYVFLGWKDNQGNTLSEDTTFSITMPQKELTLTAHFAEIVIDAEIIGDTLVCKNSNAVYTLSKENIDNFQWIVNGGMISSYDNSSITIKWEGDPNGVIQFLEYKNGRWIVTASLDVTVNFIPVSFIPLIHRKGARNILICTKSNLTYKWHKENQLIEGETEQYYVAENNYGSYTVKIFDGNNCPNTSSPFILEPSDSYGKSFTVYPNPTSGYFNIEIDSEEIGTGFIFIYNSSGLLIDKITINKSSKFFSKSFSTIDLPKGVYIISIKINENPIVNQKLTVN